jgi:hypothetical protein
MFSEMSVRNGDIRCKVQEIFNLYRRESIPENGALRTLKLHQQKLLICVTCITEYDDKKMRRISSSGMWRIVDLFKVDLSEELIASILTVEGISELETTRAVTSKLKHNVKLLRNIGSNKTHTAPLPRRRQSSQSSPWKPQ